jgi:ABC-type polysaccharide/polyol phosphate export permease
MNLVMLPMWVFSGVFFSSSHFPAVMQPVIKALPLTRPTMPFAPSCSKVPG